MTQKNVADAIGVGQSTYKNYECGFREPNGDTIVQLANLFGVTTDYLLGRTEPASQTKPLDIIAQQTNMEAAEKAALEKWLSLNKSHRESVLQIMRDIIKAAEDAGQERQTEIIIKKASRNGAAPSTEIITQAEADEIRSRPDADPDL